MKSQYKLAASGFLFVFGDTDTNTLAMDKIETMYPDLYIQDSHIAGFLYRIWGYMDKWEWQALKNDPAYAIWVVTSDFQSTIISEIIGKTLWSEWACTQLINDLSDLVEEIGDPEWEHVMSQMKPQWVKSRDPESTDYIYTRHPVEVTVELRWSGDMSFEAYCFGMNLDTGNSLGKTCPQDTELPAILELLYHELSQYALSTEE